MYFMVDEGDMSLQVTNRRTLASSFFVIMSDDKIYDFHIIYLRGYNTAELRRRSVTALFSQDFDSVRPVHYYISTPLSIMGWNEGPIKLELSPKRTNTLFQLQSRLKSRDPHPEGLGHWVQGRESYFINCYRRHLARDGYIAIRRQASASNEVEFTLMCVPSRRYSVEYYMIFRLLPGATETATAMEDNSVFQSYSDDEQHSGMEEEAKRQEVQHKHQEVQDKQQEVQDEQQEVQDEKQEVQEEQQEVQDEKQEKFEWPDTLKKHTAGSN